VKGAECLNRQASRSILPMADRRTRMVMAGNSKAEIVSAIKAAFANKQLPDLENGAMAFSGSEFNLRNLSRCFSSKSSNKSVQLYISHERKTDLLTGDELQSL
jgi:hypothetical protein